MHKLLKAILLLGLATIGLFAKSTVIDNLQETKHINLSRSDVNRLVFPYDITYQANSKEKDLTISVVGKEMFVKFTPSITQETVQVKDQIVNASDPKIVYYKAKPAELFVVTEKKTYSIVVHPVKQEATTVIFTESFAEKKEKLFENKDAEYVENLINNILKPLITTKSISGFEKREYQESYKSVFIPSINANLNMTPIEMHKGYRYDVFVYGIQNQHSVMLGIPDTKELLHEINKTLNRKIIAYTLFYENRIYKIMPYKSVKLYIVTEAVHD